MALDADTYVSIKVTRFYMKVVGLWHAESQRERWILHAALFYTIVAVVFAIFIEGVDLYYSWGDFNAVTENICCTMPLIIIIFKVTVFIVRRDLVNDLIVFSEKNFWRNDYDQFGQQILKECEKKGVIMLYTLSFSVQATVCAYLTTPMIENIGRNDSDRHLPFRFWTNLPIKVSPYYEMSYIIQSLSTIHSGICFFCFDNFMGMLNIHVVGQFKILQHRLEELCEEYIKNLSKDDRFSSDYIQYPSSFGEKNSIKKFDEKFASKSNGAFRNGILQEEKCKLDEKAYDELKACVRQHLTLIDYVEKLEEIFNAILLLQMVLSSLFMCFGGYQIFVAQLSVARRVIFVLHLISAFAQLLLFTWTCNEIIVESLEVAEAAFRAKWYMMPNEGAGRSLRSALMLIMIRARKPCYISAGKFSPMSLQAFTSILSTTMSYFTLLRQCSEGI